jgi:hypothetical protein
MTIRANLTALVALVLLGLLPSGCATMRGGQGWGRNAIHPFDWQRIPEAARRAALDPATWAPAASALVMSIDDFDQRASDWAVKHHPLFGNGEAARDMSDRLREALLAETYVTGLLTPSGDDPGSWTMAKIKGGLVEGAGLWAVNGVTNEFKDLAGRERPDGQSNRSFPSGHTSMAFAGARLSNRNLDAMNMNGAVRNTLKTVNLAAAATVGWARVEGQKHYPADVLAGAALGNFLTLFIHDAFIGIPQEDLPVDLRVEPSPEGIRVVLSRNF